MNASTNVCCLVVKTQDWKVWMHDGSQQPLLKHISLIVTEGIFTQQFPQKIVYGQRPPSLIESSGMQCLRCVVEHEHRKPFLHCIDSLVVWLRWAQICTFSWCPVRSGWKLLDRCHGSDLCSGRGHLQRKHCAPHVNSVAGSKKTNSNNKKEPHFNTEWNGKCCLQD